MDNRRFVDTLTEVIPDFPTYANPHKEQLMLAFLAGRTDGLESARNIFVKEDCEK